MKTTMMLLVSSLFGAFALGADRRNPLFSSSNSLMQPNKMGKAKAVKGFAGTFPAAGEWDSAVDDNGFFFGIYDTTGGDITLAPPAANPDGYDDNDHIQLTNGGTGLLIYTDPFTGYTYTFREGDILCLCYDLENDQWIVTG